MKRFDAHRDSPSCNGLTLIEMLVVIVILGILLSMTLQIGSGATREAAVEASAQQFATTIRMSSMLARMKKEPYTVVLNTTKNGTTSGKHPEEIRWGNQGIADAAYSSDFPNGVRPPTEVLKQYTQDFFDMTGENHWYAVVGGTEMTMNSMISGTPDPDSYGKETAGSYRIQGKYRLSQPSTQGPVLEHHMRIADSISADYTDYYLYPMSELTVFNGTDSNTIKYDQANPQESQFELYENNSWILAGTYPVPFSKIDPSGMQKGPLRRLRDGVRFWNVHEDFDVSKGEGNYIPGFEQVNIGGTPEPSMYDPRAGGVGHAAYRGMGMLNPNINRDTGKRQLVIGTQLFFRPGSGDISRLPKSNGTYTAFGGYFGKTLQLTSDEIRDTDHYYRTGNESSPFFYGMVDNEDLSYYRIIQVDPATGVVDVSKRPHMAW